MSDDQNKENEQTPSSQNDLETNDNSQTGTAPSSSPPANATGAKPGGGGLPGLGGAKPGGGGLPGLGGAKPGGGLAGLGGAKPGGGGLPGLGGAKPGGGLPGLGGAKPGGGLPGVGSSAPGPAGGPVPDFIKKKQEEERQAAMARDPFGASNLPPQRPSFMPEEPEMGVDSGPPIDAGVVGKSKKLLIIVAAVIAVLCMGVGYGAGTAVAQRGFLNKVLGDAWIIQYEMEKLRDIHQEVAGMVNMALNEARQKKFNKTHAGFLVNKVSGNPFNPRLFTERNYKTLNPMVVQMMAELYRDWEKLSEMIATHNMKVQTDAKQLEAAGDEFKKLLETNYGVIFSRNEKMNNQLVANLVIIGAAEGDAVTVQAKVGGASSERKVYNPEGEDSELTKSPDEFVVMVDPMSKETLLKNATQSHFDAYTERLSTMSRLLKEMDERQENMFGPLNDNCSREPVSFLAKGVDPRAEFEEYKAKSQD